MSALATAAPRIPAMTDEAKQRVRAFEAVALQQPQTPILTRHLIHGGMYARTIRIPAGVVLTGAEIKLATVLVVSGHCRIATGGEPIELAGYHVLPASAGRKQAFVAIEDTDLTMLFPTQARTVAEAEEQFTDEAARLFSRTGENEIHITGE